MDSHRNDDRRNDHHSRFHEVSYKPRLSQLATYDGPYMHDIESMRRARDYLHSYCSRSIKPIWKKIYISTNSHAGFRGTDFGPASNKFCYADFPDDVSYHSDDDRTVPYQAFHNDEKSAPSDSPLPSPGWLVDDNKHEPCPPYGSSPPVDDDVFSPDVSDKSLQMKPGNQNMRLSSYLYEGVDHAIRMSESDTDTSTLHDRRSSTAETGRSIYINHDRRASSASYSTSNNRQALQCLYDNSQAQKFNATPGFRHYSNTSCDLTVAAGNQNLIPYSTTLSKCQPFTNELHGNNNNTNMFTTLPSDHRNHNCQDSSSNIGCSPWRSNLHQSYGNSNYSRSVANPLYGNGNITSQSFPIGQSMMQHTNYPSYHDNSPVESLSPGFHGYCNKKRSYNTAFTDLTHSKFQGNLNQPCCDTNCASCVGTPSYGYHTNKMSYSTTCTDFSTSQVLSNLNEPCFDNANYNGNYGETPTSYYKKKRSYDAAFSSSQSSMSHATQNMNSNQCNNTVNYIANPSLQYRDKVPYNMAFSSSQWQTGHGPSDDNNNNNVGYVGCPVLACNP